MKNNGHLGRSYLKGPIGDAINVMRVACGHNLRKILAWLRYFFRPQMRAALCLAGRHLEH